MWIVGHAPAWLTGVRHIPVEHDPRLSRWANSRRNRLAAFTHPDVADQVALFNDDFYVMKPITEIPVMHLGPLIDRYKPISRPPGIAQFMEGVAVTYSWLQAHGIPEPLSFEAHVPMVVDRAAFAMALQMADCVPCEAPMVRSIYGNLVGLAGERITDVKIANATTLPPADATFLSSDDTAFDVGLVGDIVRTAFPERSRYERVEVAA